MGGISNEVRGRTKIEAWLKFQKERKGIRARFEGMHLRWPANKRDAYEQMEKDRATGEWVLKCNFHT